MAGDRIVVCYGRYLDHQRCRRCRPHCSHAGCLRFLGQYHRWRLLRLEAPTEHSHALIGEFGVADIPLSSDTRRVVQLPAQCTKQSIRVVRTRNPSQPSSCAPCVGDRRVHSFGTGIRAPRCGTLTGLCLAMGRVRNLRYRASGSDDRGLHILHHLELAKPGIPVEEVSLLAFRPCGSLT